MLLTNTKDLRLRKAFANSFSASIKFSKTQLYKIGQSAGFLCRLLGPLLKIGLPLMKSGLKPLVKNALTPFGLTAAASATDEANQKKIYWWDMATLIMFNEEMNDFIKIVKSLNKSDLLIKCISETI